MLRLTQLAVVFALVLAAGAPSAQEPEDSHEIFGVNLTAYAGIWVSLPKPAPDLDLQVLWWGSSEDDHYELPEPIEITTDQNGLVSLTLKPSAAACTRYGGRDSVLGLRCRSLQYTGETFGVNLAWANDRYEGSLTPWRTLPLYGRVLDQQGQLTDATIRIRWEHSRETEQVAVTRAGLFEFGSPPEQGFSLSAVKSGVGVSRWAESAFDRQAGTGELVLQLEGAGVIAGRVVDNAGHMMPNLPLQLAWDSELGEQPTSENGITHDATMTNDAGEFRFAGLKPGNYRVGCFVYRDNETQGSITVPTGTLKAALKFSQPMLAIRLLDATGEVVNLADYKARRVYLNPGQYELVDLDHPHASTGLPEEDALEVFAAPNDPELSLYVRAGKRYQLNLWPHEGPVLSKTVTISETEPLSQLELRQPDPADLGSLRIEIEGAHEREENAADADREPASFRGNLFPAQLSWSDFMDFDSTSFYSVRSVGTNLAILSGTFPSTGNSIQLPSGEYWITIRDQDPMSPLLPFISDYESVGTPFYSKQQVRIEAGQETHLIVKPETAYSIRFNLLFNEDREALAEIPMSAIKVRSLSLSKDLDVHWGSLPKQPSMLSEFGVAHHSLELFPPGKYLLMFTHPGFEPVRREFELSNSRAVIDLRLAR